MGRRESDVNRIQAALVALFVGGCAAQGTSANETAGPGPDLVAITPDIPSALPDDVATADPPDIVEIPWSDAGENPPEVEPPEIETPEIRQADTGPVDPIDAGRPVEDEGPEPPDDIGDDGLIEGCLSECPSAPQPICALLGDTSEVVDHLNPCTFACSKAPEDSLECDGPCAELQQCPQCSPQGCAPVCGADGATYRNACYADCLGGVVVAQEGACCGCPEGELGDQWCSQSGQDFPTLCALTCAGEIPAKAGPCGISCPAEGCIAAGETEYAPVCATTLDAQGAAASKTFANACQASCVGALEITPGVCAGCDSICQEATPFAHCGAADCVLYPNNCVPTKCMATPADELTKLTCPAECPE
jgi:hypothetical protein